MTPEAASAARQLLSAATDGGDALAIAAHAAAVCQLLAKHLARLIGELGVRTMFARSLALSGAAFPCVKGAGAGSEESPYDALQRCLERESPDVATEAAVHVFQAFIELLERFIGAGLVAGLLHEVWPTIFAAPVAKETK